MKQYICEKHGILSADERIKWSNSIIGGRWCVHCINEMMDKYCAKINEVEIEDNKKGDL